MGGIAEVDGQLLENGGKPLKFNHDVADWNTENAPSKPSERRHDVGMLLAALKSRCAPKRRETDGKR